MKTLFRIGILLLAAWALSGCESTKSKPEEENLSQLPQNRPQSWEGSAALGSFFPNAN